MRFTAVYPRVVCINRQLFAVACSRTVVILLLCWVGLVVAQLSEEEKAKIADEAAKKVERANRQGGGLNPLAVLVLLLAISIGE